MYKVNFTNEQAQHLYGVAAGNPCVDILSAKRANKIFLVIEEKVIDFEKRLRSLLQPEEEKILEARKSAGEAKPKLTDEEKKSVNDLLRPQIREMTTEIHEYEMDAETLGAAQEINSGFIELNYRVVNGVQQGFSQRHDVRLFAETDDALNASSSEDE